MLRSVPGQPGSISSCFGEEHDGDISSLTPGCASDIRWSCQMLLWLSKAALEARKAQRCLATVIDLPPCIPRVTL